MLSRNLDSSDMASNVDLTLLEDGEKGTRLYSSTSSISLAVADFLKAAIHDRATLQSARDNPMLIDTSVLRRNNPVITRRCITKKEVRVNMDQARNIERYNNHRYRNITELPLAGNL